MKEIQFEYKFSSMFIILGLFIGGIFFYTFYSSNQAVQNTISQLEFKGFTVVTGESNSPTIMQTTTNLIEFIRIANSINASVVYRDGTTFIVIANSTYGCEYQA